MPDKLVTVVRPDGTRIQSTPEDARILEATNEGYHVETSEELGGRLGGAEEERYYSTPGQLALTALEGAGSGATLGLIEPLILDEDTQARAKHNPGTRLAFEIAGAVAPSLLAPGAGSAAAAARLTPAGALAAGSLRATRGLGAIGRVAGAAAIEGAGAAAGSEFGREILNGDPVSVESIAGAAGWGSLFGAGAGLAAAGFQRGSERVAARLHGDELAERLDDVAQHAIPEDAYRAFRDNVDDFVFSATKTAAQADEAMHAVVPVAETPLETLGKTVTDAHAGDNLLQVRAAADDVLGSMTLGGQILTAEGKAARSEILSAYKAASKAVEDGNPEGITAALEKYQGAVTKANALFDLGHDVPSIEMRAAQEATAGATSAGTDAMERVLKLRAAAKSLSDLPAHPGEFVRMGRARAERLFAGLESALEGSGDDLDAVRSAITQATDDLSIAVGVSPEFTSDPVSALRSAWKAARSASQASTIARTRAAVESARNTDEHSSFLSRWLRLGAQRAASKFARAHGGGPFTSAAAHTAVGAAFGSGPFMAAGLVAELTGLRAAVQSGLTGAVAEFGPGVGATAGRLAGQGQALRVRLDGTEDRSEGSERELFERRSAEIRAAIPVARDTLYRAVEPLAAAGHQDFAAQLHKSAVTAFDALAARLPRDPGTAFNVTGTLWSPTPVEMLRFSRYYAVFQDPVGAAISMLRNPSTITPDNSAALREVAPALFNDVRMRMLERLGNPEFAKSLSRNDQAALSLFLDVPLHSTMRPAWIAAQQMMFRQRNEQPSAGKPSGPPGRPPGPAAMPGATAAQITTER